MTQALVLLFLWLIFATPGLAQSEEKTSSFKRTLNMEWENVEGSRGFELEVTRVMKSGQRRKPLYFKSKEPKWAGTVNAGRYEVRLRSSDERGVFGEWSAPTEVWARLPNPAPIAPAANASIKSPDEEVETVHLEWSSVPGAAGYWLEVKNEAGETAFEGAVETKVFKQKLAVAKRYNWRIATIMPEDEKPPLNEVASVPFVVIGAPLKPAKLSRPESKFVTRLEWPAVAHATHYAFEILRFNGNQWKRLESGSRLETPEIPLNPNYPGGQMRLKVVAHSELRQPSSVSVMEFNAYEGLRTPDAIEIAKLKEAIEHEHDQICIGSYLISSIDYQGRNRQAGRVSRFSALTGTGRFGYGHFPSKSQWGLLGMVDLSGTLIQKRNYLFYSGELQAVWRRYVWEVTQLRIYGGGYLRQLPEAVEQPDGRAKVMDLSALGPHAGIQVWYPITYKLGVQFNTQVLYSLVGVKTPNGRDISPSLSYQLGVLGSYRLRENTMGSIGYAYRHDSLNYKAKPFDGTDTNNFATAGDINEVSINGHYLNLFFEWGF